MNVQGSELELDYPFTLIPLKRLVEGFDRASLQLEPTPTSLSTLAIACIHIISHEDLDFPLSCPIAQPVSIISLV
jgi:hypothetical protein